MAGEASISKDDEASADSYIGSLISLISNSEFRYEGLLFDINTPDSTIALRNVKSFGTEGRKKDGPQVPPSDKVYEYILFRGNDIKDLQVKSSHPVESTSSLLNDPAIIQSHYSQGAATSTSSQTLQAQLPTSKLLCSSLPLYQPLNPISSSWDLLTPVPPITNSSSFPMPMYIKGFYGASEGIQASLQSPPGLLIRPSMHQYSVNNASTIPSTTSNFSALPFSVSNASLLPPIGASTGTLNFNLISPTQSSALFSDSSTTLMSNNSLTPSLPATVSYSSLPLASPSSTFSISVPDKDEHVSSVSMSYDTGFKPLSSDSGATSSLLNNRGSAPLIVTPNQLLQQPGPTTSNGLLRPGPTLQPPTTANQDLRLGNAVSQVLQPGPTPTQVFQAGPNSTQLLQTEITAPSLNYSSDSTQKEVEVVQIPSTERPLITQSKILAPLLPLPLQHDYKVNGYQSYARFNGRGPRDRLGGHGGSRHITKFTEEFDFTAMNEKFKKDEIWGDLGKSNTTIEEQGSPTIDHAGKSNMELKPVYVKDDFFDSLSCNVSDRGSSKNGRTNFSEQRKLDVETFGNYARNRGGHGHNHGRRGYVHGRQGYNRGGHGYGGNNAPRGYAHGYNGNDRRTYSSGYNHRSYGHHAS